MKAMSQRPESKEPSNREYLCCEFRFGAPMGAIFVVKKATEDIELRCMFCQASCAFVITKATCRPCVSGRFHRCFASRKSIREPWNPDNSVTMTQRTKYFQLRLTQEEYDSLKAKSVSYSSVSHYIRSAIKEYSDIGAKQKFQLLNDLSSFYRKFQDELSWAGGNLNQSVKRANELAVAGLLSPAYIAEVLMPSINSTRKTLDTIKLELLNVTKKAIE